MHRKKPTRLCSRAERKKIDHHKMERWCIKGVPCEILTPNQGWKKGKVKITLEFCPDEVESPLEGIRQDMNKPGKVSELVARRIKNVAIVEVRFAELNFQTIVRDVRATLFDKVSLVGGTFGLFTGISVISLVEIVFWIYKWGQSRKIRALA